MKSKNFKTKLIVALPALNIYEVKNMFRPENSAKCVYLGENSLTRRSLRQRLGGSFSFINISKLLDSTANNIRHEFVGWIDSINKLYGHEPSWWFSDVFSRNIYTGKLFQYSCYITLIDSLYKTENAFPSLIIVESYELAKSIRKWGDSQNLQVTIIGHRPVYALIKNCSSFLKSWITTGILYSMRFLAAFVSKIKYGSKTLKDTAIIVSTFVHSNSINEQGSFSNRYFPFLHEYLEKRNETIAIHPLLYGFGYSFFSIYNRLRKSNVLFIIQEDFLKISDYFLAFINVLKMIFMKISLEPFRNFDLSPVVRKEMMQLSPATYTQAYLIYRLFLRLKDNNIYPKIIIDWYENLILNKALIAGSRQVFPKAKIIGAQMFIHSPNIISLYPSQSEADARMVPDIILETSTYQCEKAKTFTEDIICRPAPALRYAHVFDSKDTIKKDYTSATVAVLLPFDLTGAIELLEILENALPQINKNARLLLKCHPDYTKKDLIKAFNNGLWPQKFELFEKQLPELLSEASVVVSSNSSSMLESLSKGIPLVFIARQTSLTLNPAAGLDFPLITECFSPEETAAAVNHYLSISESEKAAFVEMGAKIRDLYFTPVNEINMSSFLGE